MSLQGVQITRGRIGANTLSVGDGVSAIIIGAPAATGLAQSMVKHLYGIKDAEAVGIDAGFDQTNNVNAHRHISEFYREAGEGSHLYVMLVDPTKTMVEILEDTGSIYAKKVLSEAGGDVRQLAVAVNPTGATTHLNGLPDDVYNAIAKAQGLYDWADSHYMPIQILLEGYDYAGDASTVADLRDLPNLQAHKVSVIIGQDWAYSESKTGNAQKYADVGTALGVLSKAAINQNIGDVESFNITDATKSIWMVPGLSSHQKNSDVIEHLQTLDTKGYIFGVEYTGISGVRFNDDHTCTPIIMDAEHNVNEYCIAFGRTHDKARRKLRTTLLPKVKTVQPTDKKTGKIPAGVIKYFENLADGVFGDMEKAREISYGKARVNPDSDLVVALELELSFEIIPYGNVGKIQGTSNLKTQV